MLIRYWQQGRSPFDRLIRSYLFADIGKAFSDIAAGRSSKPFCVWLTGHSWISHIARSDDALFSKSYHRDGCSSS